ncbi:hypothetical protein XENORESO_000320 [Xenotaenia resolanae]|uniref:Uncharacterized protein n=1 Tax=Xenotaenia resolanae TaxID=208358 RepID=A0ABV0WBS0_9TELE
MQSNSKITQRTHKLDNGPFLLLCQTQSPWGSLISSNKPSSTTSMRILFLLAVPVQVQTHTACTFNKLLKRYSVLVLNIVTLNYKLNTEKSTFDFSVL